MAIADEILAISASIGIGLHAEPGRTADEEFDTVERAISDKSDQGDPLIDTGRLTRNGLTWGGATTTRRNDNFSPEPGPEAAPAADLAPPEQKKSPLIAKISGLLG